ncbi:MAG: hypothetical protein JOZ19_01365 [Rubrobacter sp.]|nr:hypothetical protein [Rubrobacter sp.]
MRFPTRGYRVASASAPSWGSTGRVASASASASSWDFTGRRIKTEEARKINLVERVVGQGEALDAAKELSNEIAANGLITVRHAKAALNRAFDVDLARGLEFETDQFAVLFSTEDAKEGVGAFAEGREANFQG